nr:LuxR C-terminal-related transcriptional regulator [Corynebacterium kalidii]
MVERCRQERRAAGVTLPGGDGGDGGVNGVGGAPAHQARVLTTQEEQIAVMAADGSTNRDIARELTLSTKTVEHHLTNCYHKLGIGGRAGLSEALQRR